MSEPRRLHETSSNPIARQLLARGRREAPPAGAPDRALAALGLPVLGAPPSPSAPTAIAAKSVGLASAVKWGGALVLGGSLATGAVTAARLTAPAPVPRSAASSISAAAPRIDSAPPDAPIVAATMEAATPVPPAVAPAAGPPATATTPRRSRAIAAAPRPSERPPHVQETQKAPSIAAELAALDGARQAYLAGDPRGALAELDAFDAAFPRSQLADEAIALRIEALDSAGLRGAARALASRFLGTHPDSPYADSIRRVITNSTRP